MAMTTILAFYAGMAMYLVAAAMALRYLRDSEPRALAQGERLLVAGMALLIASFVARWIQWGRLPLTTMTDSLSFFAVLSGVAALVVLRRWEVKSLLCVYLPALSVICLFAAATAHQNLHEAPRPLRGVFLAIHVGLALLAYAMFFVAAMTSVVYLAQARRLKQRKAAPFAFRAPSLEELDRVLFRLVGYGYVLFAGTLLLGLVWAWIDRQLHATYWWLAPKVLLSFLMAAIYAAMFHLRRTGRLRGPKLAGLVFAAFVLLILGYTVLSVLHLRGYNFWSPSA